MDREAAIEAGAPTPRWVRPGRDGRRLSLRVQPGAARTEVVGELGEQLKVRVAAAPSDGKANDALVRFIAASLGVPRADVVVVAGHTSRSKVVLVPPDADPTRLLPRA